MRISRELAKVSGALRCGRTNFETRHCGFTTRLTELDLAWQSIHVAVKTKYFPGRKMPREYAKYLEDIARYRCNVLYRNTSYIAKIRSVGDSEVGIGMLTNYSGFIEGKLPRDYFPKRIGIEDMFIYTGKPPVVIIPKKGISAAEFRRIKARIRRDTKAA